ncbi:MAG: GmrSD restriction endonuclease domain-containing protein [Candidatus Helarchaeota archaeon]
MKLSDLLTHIEKKDLVLPEFQREYVWTEEQAKQLFISLFREYPVGALLFWKTDKPPKVRNVVLNKESLGRISLILDGQQRLTTLYLLIKDAIPPYYTKREIKTDPRHLFFNIKTNEFKYYQPTIMKNNEFWIKVTECFKENNKINVISIAEKVCNNNIEKFSKLANQLNENLIKLRDILKREIPVEYIPSNANVDEAIDIFDKVNSMGTKLADYQLALTHIIGKWPEANETFKKKINELENKNFFFDIRFIIRCLVGIINGRALFNTIHRTPRDKIIEGWKKLDKILDYIITILPKHAYINSTEDLNTTNVIVPFIVYLSKNKDSTFQDKISLNRAIRWLYLANLWRRYTGQTDQRLESDINIVMRTDDPWDILEEAIIEQRGRIKLEPDDVKGKSIMHPIYKMLYIIVKAKGAIDWFNGSPLDITHGKSYSIQSHHIFPKSILYKKKFNSKDPLDIKIVNEIANRAFLTAATNMSKIIAKPPKEYFNEIIAKFGIDALKNQLIPLKEKLWDLNNYKEFLEERRKMISKEINKYISNFVSREKLVEEKEESVLNLIQLGESDVLEFKSSVRWDYFQEKINKALELAIIKTIAGFMNSEGGILLIGVNDDGEIIGIEKDLETLKKKNLDGFQLLIIDIISKYVGKEFANYIKLRFETVNENIVCIVNVKKNSSEPVFVKFQGKKEFYIRFGNSTRLLDSEETYKYIYEHWR